MPYLGNVPAENYAQVSYQDLTGGSGTSFTLDYAVGSAGEIEVFVNNVRQEPTVAYTVSGTSLTMTGSIAATDDFYVVFQGKAEKSGTIPEKQTDGTYVFPDDVTVNGNITSTGIDDNATSTAMTLDSSGNLLVGTTDNTVYNNSGSGTGINLQNFGNIAVARDGNDCMVLNRLNSDGPIALFNKDGSSVGSIASGGGRLAIGDATVGLRFVDASTDRISPWNLSTQADRDNAVDLGESSARFDDIYATNATIQTSDRNDKQDIAELDEAEKRVATAAKGLIRKFRWIDSVAEKGDDARIHVGVIAQDLQAAFEAEGLDAGRYAMFIRSTWWEATETYTDDEGVEQTRVNTYETAEEAPEGAVERTRLGVRYPELLAFIIGAL